MKFYILSLVFLLLSGHAYPQTAEIAFEEKSYEEILASLQQNDAIGCLYFHFDGCGACTKMKKTVFNVDSIADYYNTHFQNFSINTKTPLGEKVNQHFGVRSHPTFIFINGKGEEIHRVQFVSGNEFYAHAQRVFEPEKTLRSYHRRYESGDRGSDFLFEYTYLLKDAGQLDSLNVCEYLATQPYEDLSKERNIRYIYEFCLLGGYIRSFSIYHPAFQHMWENKQLYAKYFDARQVDTRLLLMASGQPFSNRQEFDEVISLVEPFENQGEFMHKDLDGAVRVWINSDNLVLRMKMGYERDHGEMSAYYDLRDAFVETMADDWERLNNYAWEYTMYEDVTPEEIVFAGTVALRSIALNRNYNNLDTYANLLFLQGRLEEALSKANEAIAKAKEDGLKYPETEKLIQKIKSKLSE